MTVDQNIQDLTARAKGGDRTAFDALVKDSLPKARGVIWRMIGHPEDCEDILQTSLIKAWENIGTFAGRSAFSTWLISIATRTAIDHLRAQKRWRRESQIAYANLCATDETLQGEVMGAMMEPEFVFDAKEHIAYCRAGPSGRDGLFEPGGRECAQRIGLGVAAPAFRGARADGAAL